MFVYQRFPILAGEITTFPDFPHGFFRGPGREQVMERPRAVLVFHQDLWSKLLE